MKKPLLFTLLFFVLLSVFSLAYAAQKPKDIRLIVSPPIFEPQLEKGQLYSNKITLKNKNNFAIPIETQIVNFTAADELGKIKFEKGEGADWFSIKSPNFILKPKEVKNIPFRIKVPADANRGGHYITMLFRAKMPSFYFKEGDSKIIPNVGVLFLMSVGKRGVVNFEILESKIPDAARLKFVENIIKTTNKKNKEPLVAKSAKIPFIFRVKNNDIYHVKPSGTLTVLSKSKKVIGTINFRQTTILPGQVRQMDLDFSPSSFEKYDKYLPSQVAGFFSDNFYIGNYRVFVNLHGSGEVNKEMTVMIFPWKGVLLIVFGLVLAVFVVIKIIKERKKIKKKTIDITKKAVKHGKKIIAPAKIVHVRVKQVLQKRKKRKIAKKIKKYNTRKRTLISTSKINKK
jgi:hypothetical protein